MQFPPTADRARIAEIFSSLQGEGPRMGERHLFIRFEECHIHCRYCDELGKPAQDWELERVLAEVERLEREEGPHSFVSFTGGEPLLYLRFLTPLAEALRAKGFRIYLETDGILWQALSQFGPLADCIAMDMKPSSVTGEKNFDADHERFLKIALQYPGELFVKIVLDKGIDLSEFDAQVEILARLAPEMPLVLQAVSPGPGQPEEPAVESLLYELQKMAGRRLRNVRILPRLHKLLNLR